MNTCTAASQCCQPTAHRRPPATSTCCIVHQLHLQHNRVAPRGCCARVDGCHKVSPCEVRQLQQCEMVVAQADTRVARRLPHKCTHKTCICCLQAGCLSTPGDAHSVCIVARQFKHTHAPPRQTSSTLTNWPRCSFRCAHSTLTWISTLT